MTATPLTVTYTTQTEMESLFGRDGVLLRLDDNETDALESSETVYLTDIIEEASHEINFHCIHRYKPAILEANSWIHRACSVIAVYFLSQRRGDPEQYLSYYTRIMERLKLIRDNKWDLPLTAKRTDETPAMSNLIVDDVHPRSKLRVETHISEGGTDGSQHPDRRYFYDPY